MKVAVCSAQSYDRQFLLAANRDAHHELVFFESHLSEETRQMVSGFPVVCVFVNDTLDSRVLETLAAQGTRLVALRAVRVLIMWIFSRQTHWESVSCGCPHIRHIRSPNIPSL